MLFRLWFLILVLCPIVFGLDTKQIVDYAVKQYSKLTKTVKTGTQYPSTGDPMSTTWHMGGPVGWTSGFYPGILWHLYNYTKSEEWKKLAIEATDGMVHDQNLTSTHDIGFMIMCSYGIGYEFTKNQSYLKVIENAAHHLATRFSRELYSIYPNV
jgi:rhamnogalacturonyl hydrolase YesR